jgi:hypothetical protein
MVVKLEKEAVEIIASLIVRDVKVYIARNIEEYASFIASLDAPKPKTPMERRSRRTIKKEE